MKTKTSQSRKPSVGTKTGTKTRTCACGCGGVPKFGQFLPGHDMKLKSMRLEAKRTRSSIKAVRERRELATA